MGSCGVQLQPLVDALRLAVLGHRVIHADETPVQMLKPASQRNGKTHRAYLWAYTPSQHEELKAVVYNFCESRAGSHAKAFLENWQGTLVVDDYSGYKQLMGERITEAGCWAHARRKFFELHAASKSQIAQQALLLIGELYELERQGQNVDAGLHLPNRDIAGQHRWRAALPSLTSPCRTTAGFLLSPATALSVGTRLVGLTIRTAIGSPEAPP